MNDKTIERVFRFQRQCESMAASVAKIATYGIMNVFDDTDDWKGCVKVHIREIRRMLKAIEGDLTSMAGKGKK
jgi:hypothetical protein